MSASLWIPRSVKQKAKIVPSTKNKPQPTHIDNKKTEDGKLNSETLTGKRKSSEAELKSDEKQLESTANDAVEQVLTEIVNDIQNSNTKTSSSDPSSKKSADKSSCQSANKSSSQSANKSPTKSANKSPTKSANKSACQSESKSFTETVGMEKNAPYVDTGPVSYSKKVPVYKRSRVPSQNSGQRDANNYCYTDVAWEPASGSRQQSKQRRREPQFNRNDLYHPRQWEYTDTGRQYLQRPSEHRGFEFTVMSYNILSQNLLEDNRSMYHLSPPHTLTWEHRSKLLLKEISYHSPDVICFQEMHCDHYVDFFVPELKKKGYEGAYIQRSGGKFDGCATFYKLSKFECDKVVHVPYYVNNGRILDRDNVGLVIRLKPKSSSVPSERSLVVANTHLLFNPKRGDIKLAQLMILLAEIDKCAHIGRGRDMYHSLVICGDFNSLPNSDIYKLIVMGFLEYEGLEIKKMSGQQELETRRYGANTLLVRNFFPSKVVGINDSCQYSKRDSGQSYNQNGRNQYNEMDAFGTGVLRHQLRCMSVYKHWMNSFSEGRKKEITTHHGNAACSVDYIFYGVRSGMVRFYNNEVQTMNVVDGNLHLLARYTLLSKTDLDQMSSLPNSVYGSDHLCLIAKFLLT